MWLVIWTLTMTVPAECPDFKPDPYTGRYPMTHCLVYHTKTVTKDMSKSFETKEEAEKFISDAPDDIRSTMRLVWDELEGGNDAKG